MQYGKKVILLKQESVEFCYGGEVRGVLRAEQKTDGKTELKLSLLNLAKISGGDYYVAVNLGEIEFIKLENLDGIEFEVENFEGNFALVCVRENEFKVVLSGEIFDGKESKAEFVKRAEKCIKRINCENFDQKTDYDDDLIATENYYKFSEGNTENFAGENNGERNETENEFSESENGYGERKKESPFFENDFDGNGKYFDKIASEIDGLFKKYPEETNLQDTVPDSKWVKIYYDDEKYYTVGVMYSGGEPCYICYGVPGMYGETPKNLEGYCMFIPKSQYFLKGEGYYVMYQDANTGKCLKNG